MTLPLPNGIPGLLALCALCAFATSGLLVPPRAVAAPIAIDRVIAVVNNGVITEQELARRVVQVQQQLSQQKVATPSRTKLERQILERMITERSLLDLAEGTSLKVSAEALDRTLTRMATENRLSLPEFRKALEQEGQDWNGFREQIRNEMTIARLREREVDNKVSVTDAEIALQLTQQSEKTAQAKDEYELAHILITVPEAASPEVSEKRRQRAEEALAKLRSGDDFAEVSALYSDAQNALEGGKLGWRSTAQLPNLFAGAVTSLKPGDTSALLRSANGFHILKLLGQRGANTAYIVRQTQASHILIKTNELVGDNEARHRLTDLRERLVHGARFADLARLNSDDLSASRGGELGWLSPGDTVPEFERAMDALAPNEISQPIASPFGWHLIQVIARRDQDLSEERRRIEARRMIRARKAEEAFDDWVRQTRDRAYIEVRLEDR
jgi:peptidyl-prolyl cis-trans isomerase SurA